MYNRVLQYIQRKGFFGEKARPICAVSGGVDSMVLASILYRAGYAPIIAHVNHCLRAAESDADEKLVNDWASERNLEFLSLRVRIETERQKDESIQMTARRLRYNWFNELLARYEDSELATAHHADDSIESLLMGMVRGTGVRGLVGVPQCSGKIVRPLLCVHRSEIEDYAKAEEVPFRSDKSNQDPKYLRNRIRHELIPLIEELSGQSKRPLVRFAALLNTVSKKLSQDLFIACMESNGTFWYALHRLKNNELALAQLLQAHQVHPDTINRVLEALANENTGQCFEYGHGQFLVQPDRLVFSPSSRNRNVDMTWKSLEELTCDLVRVNTLRNELGTFAYSNEFAFLDAAKCLGKVRLRNWQNGDRMHPWGMEGSKLISDMLNEAKLDRFQKEDALVLTIDERIVWLVGIRIAKDFGISSNTKAVFKLEYQPMNWEQESNS